MTQKIKTPKNDQEADPLIVFGYGYAIPVLVFACGYLAMLSPIYTMEIISRLEVLLISLILANATVFLVWWCYG